MDKRHLTRQELFTQLEVLRSRVKHLEAAEAERRQVEDALRASEEKFRTLLEWTYDWELWVSPQGDTYYCSPSCKRITGWAPEDFLSNPDLKLQIVHPDSRNVFERHYEMIHDAAGGASQIEYKIITRDGTERWLEHVCRPLFRSGGGYLGHRISNRDITDRKQVEESEHAQRTLAEALGKSAAVLNSTLDFDEVLNRILDNVGVVVDCDSVGVFILDEARQIVRLYGYRDASKRFVDENEVNFNIQQTRNLREMLATHVPVIIDDVKAYDGWLNTSSADWIRSSLGVPINVRGEIIGFLSLASAKIGRFSRLDAEKLQAFVNHAAIAIENARLYEELHKLAVVDALTDLYNRRYFDDILDNEYSRHSRSGKDLSLLMMDVDHFKAFNDLYGHVRGDQCLREIANVIKDSTARPSDVAARYGGEEFVCLLPETNLSGAIAIAEHIRRGVKRLAIPHESSVVSKIVTISIGLVTTRCSRNRSAVDLIANADKQLYIAKSRGRNRVEALNAAILSGALKPNKP